MRLRSRSLWAAVTSAGAYDTAFAFTGRRSLRFSDYGSSRLEGATSFRRILLREDGSFYVVGTHRNEGADEVDFGGWDFAMARLRSNGINDNGFSDDGVRIYAFGAQHGGVSDDGRSEVGNLLKDAIFYRGNILLLGARNE